MNRFVWNLRYPDAVSFPGMILWAGSVTGPRVAPGKYQVRLTVDGKSYQQPLTLRLDPRVKIAVIDSGIKWDERELVHKAALNDKELANAKPLTDAGAPCGGTGDLAGFDCNGDGILTVSDYKDRNFGRAYGVWSPGMGLLARAVFVVDEHDKVTHVEYVTEMTHEPDYAKAIEAAKKL